MSTSLLIPGNLEIPEGIDSLADYRRWAGSKEFLEQGRIDFIPGRVEADMSPDNLYFHSAPKSEVGAVIRNRLKSTNLGQVFVDKSRVSVPSVDLSAEPNVVVVLDASLISGRIQLVPTAGDASGSYIEFAGPPDLIVKVVSDSSRLKDTKLLFAAYFVAGVTEYWIVDSRGTELRFQIHTRGADRFVPVMVDSTGFQNSAVPGTQYRLERSTRPTGQWDYELLEGVTK